MYDGILEQEARENLREQGLGCDEVEATIDEMRDAGMFEA